MPAHRAGPPAPVLKVLPCEASPRRARVIPDANVRVEIDARAHAPLPAIELGILVVREALVIPPAALEARHAKGRVMAVVHESAAPPAAMSGAAGTDRRIGHPSDGALKAGFAARGVHRD